MRSEDSTQFGISARVKDRLDGFKAQNKNVILKRYALQRRLVTNTVVIEYLLDLAEAKTGKKTTERRRVQ